MTRSTLRGSPDSSGRSLLCLASVRHTTLLWPDIRDYLPVIITEPHLEQRGDAPELDELVHRVPPPSVVHQLQQSENLITDLKLTNQKPGNVTIDQSEAAFSPARAPLGGVCTEGAGGWESSRLS